MRKLKNPYNVKKSLPRMSWHPHNLFNLFQRTYGPEAKETIFTRTSKSVYWQRWKSKAVTRGYHGDWIQEKKFKRHYLPASLPKIPPQAARASTKYRSQESKVPLAAMMYTEVERRLDVVIFRSCFADSVYEARRMVLHGAVKLNGVNCIAPWTRLHPNDMITVQPDAIPFLNPGKSWPNGLGDSYDVDIEDTKKSPTNATESTKAEENDHAGLPLTADVAVTKDDVLVEDKVPAAEILTEASEAVKVDEVVTEAKANDPPEADEDDPTLDASTSDDQPGSTDATELSPVSANRPFRLPPYASPFLFIPAYLEVSFRVCSTVYLRHPASGPGFCEIPTPWDADGEVMRLAWEWYTRQGLGRRVRKERNEWDEWRDTRRNPFAEGHLRKTSIGGRVAVNGRYQGGRIGRAHMGSGEPRILPQMS